MQSTMWFCVFALFVAVSNASVPLIGSLPEGAFSSSSNSDLVMCVPYNSRVSSPQAWCPYDNGDGEYLQINLGHIFVIESISVYPRAKGSWQTQYVKTYTLSYSIDGSTFSDYPVTLNGPIQGTGNDDNDVTNSILDPTITAQYLKFTPLQYNEHKSMRVEAYGDLYSVPLIGSLPNDAFSASSWISTSDFINCAPYNSRVSSQDAWCPDGFGYDEYLQINLGQEYVIESISVYPFRSISGNALFWVITYRLSYSIDGSTFIDYPVTLNGPTQATGNDNNDVANSILDPTITAQYLKFTPLEYAEYTAMRVEAYGDLYSEPTQIDCTTCCNDIGYLRSEIKDIRDTQQAIGDMLSGNSTPGIPMIDNYKDYLVILCLTLNILVIGYIICKSMGSKKHAIYQNVKYVDSSDNENTAFNN